MNERASEKTGRERERKRERVREGEGERERPSERDRARPIAAFRGSVVDEAVVAQRNLSRLRGNTPVGRRW